MPAVLFMISFNFCEYAPCPASIKTDGAADLVCFGRHVQVTGRLRRPLLLVVLAWLAVALLPVILADTLGIDQVHPLFEMGTSETSALCRTTTSRSPADHA
jgi:hypothetical protein